MASPQCGVGDGSTNVTGVGEGDAAGRADGEGDTAALGAADGEGAYVGRTAFNPPAEGMAAPGAVMMKTVSPG